MKQLQAFAACASVCVSVAAMAEQTGSAETDLWNAIDPRQPCEYKAYLEDYPKGKYASLARLRLAACQTAPSPAAAADAAASAGHEPRPPERQEAVPGPHSSPGGTGAAESAARDSEAAGGDPTVAKVEDMLRQRKIFNCAPDTQSFKLRAGVLSYSGCGFDGTRVTGQAVLAKLAARGAYVKALDDTLIQRDPALKDYVVLSVPCAQGTCYNIEVTSAGGERTFARATAAMAFYVPRSSSEEFLGLIKALAAPADLR